MKMIFKFNLKTEGTVMNQNHTNNQKFIAVMMSAVIVFVLLFSSLYILKEADHHCTGNDCAVCACIQQCENNIRLLSCGTAAKPLYNLFTIFIIFILSFSTFNLSKTTPVTQKVRLDN